MHVHSHSKCLLQPIVIPVWYHRENGPNATLRPLQSMLAGDDWSNDPNLCAGFYGGSKENDFSESEAVLRKALESGSTLLSTADCYTGFAAGEELCGNLKFIGEFAYWQKLCILEF